MIEFRPLNHLSIHLDRLMKGRLWFKVIIGLFLGAGVGVLLNPSTGLLSESISLRLADWLDLPGQIFMRLVQMIMIPLIFASIITGIVSNSSENLKTFGFRLLLYFVFTTIIAIIIGLVVTLVLKPGEYIYKLGGFPDSGQSQINPNEQTSLIENIPKIIPYCLSSCQPWSSWRHCCRKNSHSLFLPSFPRRWSRIRQRHEKFSTSVQDPRSEY